MLRNKTLHKLALITFLITVPLIAILYQAGGSSIKNKNAPLYPSMITDLGLLSKVSITDQTQTLTLVRDNDNWVISERNNYPVPTSSVQELISSLADLRIIEPKTTNPAFYSQLDVDDVTQPDSKAIKISVLDNKEQPVVQVLIGKRDGELVGEKYVERLFARKAAEQQTWLVQGILSISNSVKDWLNQPLLDLVPVEQVKRLTIKNPKTPELVIAKLAADQQDFALQGAVEVPGMRLDLDAINTLPFEISEFEILDVIAAEAQNTKQASFDWNQGVAANIESFDGVNLTLNVLKQEDKIYAKVAANAGADATPELKQQVAKFNADHRAWYYLLSPEAYKTLSLVSAESLQIKDSEEGVISIN